MCSRSSRTISRASSVLRLVTHDVVDERRRRLVAHADAGGALERDVPVGRGLPEADAQLLLERVRHALVAEHPVDDVVAERG